MHRWILRILIVSILTLTLFILYPATTVHATMPMNALNAASAGRSTSSSTYSEGSLVTNLHESITDYRAPHRRRTHFLVKSGDTLSVIARDVYGSSAYWPVLYRANKDHIQNYNTIFVGQRLETPPKPDEIPSVPALSYQIPYNPGNSGNGPPVNVSGAAAKAVAFAYAQLGCPYVWGGNGPCNSGFDCSGLMQQAWLYAGVSIPRVSWDQMSQEPAVSLNALAPGDILGMYGNSHVGMYVGGGMMIDAPVPGAVVEKVPVPWGAVDGAVRP